MASCGRIELGEFSPYVKIFEQEATLRGTPTQIINLDIHRDSTLPSTIRGQCQLKTFQIPTIVVNPLHWDKASESDREALLMHELGHCVLRREHKPGDAPDGTPQSIMRAISPYGTTYLAKRAFYLNELFFGH